MFPLIIGLLSTSAYAQDKEIRAGVCVANYFTDCSFLGTTVEYAQNSFSVGATISLLPLTFMTHGKYYYDLKFVRPFVGANVGVYLDAGTSGVIYGPSFGLDIPISRFVLRGQGGYFFDNGSFEEELQLGGSVLWRF